MIRFVPQSISLFVAADFALLGYSAYEFANWEIPAAITLASAALGLAVILRVYYSYGHSMLLALDAHTFDDQFADRLCLMLGGAFLVLPGVFTDLFGLILLLAPFRRLFIKIITEFI